MKYVKKALFAGIAGIIIVLAVAALWVVRTLSDLPDVSRLKHYRPPAATEVLDRDGGLIAHFYESKLRVWTPVSAVPDHVINAVVTAEDDTFFGHQGVNYRAVWEALKHDVHQKRFARGGSTITQQMIKNVFLSKEKTVARKLREFVLARRAEEVLTKREILEIYLNEVEWGDGIHGIEAASRFYFDKHVRELNHAEAAVLAGMLPNPRYYNPYKNPGKADQRKEQVLFNMFQAKLMTQEEYAAALGLPLQLRVPTSMRFDLAMPGESASRNCPVRALERVLARFYGHQLYREGLTVRTTLDGPQQRALSALPAGQEPERVMVVREGREIRAIACSDDAAAVRSALAAGRNPENGPEPETVLLDDIREEEIIVPTQALSGEGTGTVRPD